MTLISDWRRAASAAAVPVERELAPLPPLPAAPRRNGAAGPPSSEPPADAATAPSPASSPSSSEHSESLREELDSFRRLRFRPGQTAASALVTAWGRTVDPQWSATQWPDVQRTESTTMARRVQRPCRAQAPDESCTTDSGRRELHQWCGQSRLNGCSWRQTRPPTGRHRRARPAESTCSRRRHVRAARVAQ